MNHKAAWTLISGLLLAALLAPPIIGAPQPNQAIVDWQLDFEYRSPKPIYVKVPGETEPQLYWFVVYKVINRTGEDRYFVPDLVLYTSTGQILRAGQGVNVAVYEHIKQMLNEPLLRDNVGMTGKLLQGADNAKLGVAIFRDFDIQAARFDIFVGGLSGEYAIVDLPTPIEVTEINEDGEKVEVQKDRVILSRTLRLQYGLNAPASDRIRSKPELLKKNWVMR
jgi:hypothetical protein